MTLASFACSPVKNILKWFLSPVLALNSVVYILDTAPVPPMGVCTLLVHM